MGLIDNYIEKKIEPYKKETSKEIRLLRAENAKLSKISEEKQIFDDSFDEGKWNVIGSHTPSKTPNVNTSKYLREYYDWTYANVSRIAIAISSIDVKLMQVSGEDVKEVETHPFLDLFYRPNPFMPHSDFVRLLVVYLLMTGESPIRLRRNNPLNAQEKPTEMWLCNPSDTVVKVGKTLDNFETLMGYEVGFGKDKIELNPWEMVFINNPNPQNIWRGIGAVEASARTIAMQNASEDWNLNFFSNSARPDYVLYTDQKLQDSTLERLKNKINENHKATGKSHKPMVLESGLKIEKLQNTMKDLDFIEGMKYNRDKQMAMMGTTKAILGITEDVNRANAEASEYIFMKYTVKPIMNQIVEYLNEFLLPVFDKTGQLFIHFDDPIPENTDVINNELNLLTNKVYTINEARNIKGLEPIDGGDVIYQQTSLQPLGAEPVQLTAPEPNKTAKYRSQIVKLNNRNLRRKMMIHEIKTAIKSVLKSDVESKYRGPKYKSVKLKETIDLFVKESAKKRALHEAKLKKMVKEYLTTQESAIIKKLRKGKSATDYMFEKEPTIKVGIDLMTPMIEAIILDQGSEAFELLNLVRPYEMMAEARRYLKTQPRKSIKTMTETSYDRALKSLEEGLSNGESVAELTGRVRSVYSDMEKYQSEAVARTETSRATGFAQLDAYEQSGVVEGKEWILGGEPCPICEELATMNNQVGLHDKFTVPSSVNFDEWFDGQAPPVHVNCVCDIVPVIEMGKKAEPEVRKEIKTPEQLLKEVEDTINERSTTA